MQSDSLALVGEIALHNRSEVTDTKANGLSIDSSQLEKAHRSVDSSISQSEIVLPDVYEGSNHHEIPLPSPAADAKVEVQETIASIVPQDCVGKVLQLDEHVDPRNNNFPVFEY